MPRLFAAIDFPTEINRQVIALCHGIRDAKWVEQRHVHLTLKFFGELDAKQTELLKQALGRIQVAKSTLNRLSVAESRPTTRACPLYSLMRALPLTVCWLSSISACSTLRSGENQKPL